LVLSRPPPPLAVEAPESGNEDAPETVKLRFLQQLRDLMPLARERLAEAQGRYKRNYDRTVRPKNDGIPKDSWVYVRKEVHAAGTNPKLDDQVEGPFQVALNDGHTLILRIGDDLARVNSDRITPAPAPLLPGNNAQSPPVDGQELPLTESAPGDEPEYVIERIVGARQLRDGSLRYKIRWFGYGKDDDTWEPEEHLPEALVRKYHRKTRLPRAN
jgi:hypothetical protein